MPRRDARDSLALGSVRSYEHEYPDEQRPPGRQVFPMISLDKHSDTAALIGRLFFSSMFLLFGYGKLTDYAGTVSYMWGFRHLRYSLCLPSSLRSALACWCWWDIKRGSSGWDSRSTS